MGIGDIKPIRNNLTTNDIELERKDYSFQDFLNDVGNLALQVREVALTAFKYATKANSLMKGLSKVAALFEKLPDELGEVCKFTRSFKIIKGFIHIEKIVKNINNIVQVDDPQERLLCGWNLVYSASRIVGAVEAVFTYLLEFDLIAESATAWTQITGYVLLPITLINTALACYQMDELVEYMNEFRSKVKLGKQPNAQRMADVCQLLIKEEEGLRGVKVITKQCPLSDRMESILVRLKDANDDIRKAAIDEGKMIVKRLKDRISERVGVLGVKTAIATAACASTVFALACPIAVLPVVIFDFALLLINLANFAYNHFLPTGDITKEEQPMFYSRVLKEIRHAGRAVEGAFNHIENQFSSVLVKTLA